MIAARIPQRVGWLAPAVLAIVLMITPVLAADDASEAWLALVKGGHVAVIRHGECAARLWRRPARLQAR